MKQLLTVILMLSFSIADDFDKYTSMKSMTCINDEGKVNTVTLKDDYLIAYNGVSGGSVQKSVSASDNS